MVHGWLYPLRKQAWLTGLLRVCIWLVVKTVLIALVVTVGLLDPGPEAFTSNFLVILLPFVLTISLLTFQRCPERRSFLNAHLAHWLTLSWIVRENKRLLCDCKIFYTRFLWLARLFAFVWRWFWGVWSTWKVQGTFLFFSSTLQLLFQVNHCILLLENLPWLLLTDY